jgi:Coenzyme PQQ synthesis protein D (PqqD)
MSDQRLRPHSQVVDTTLQEGDAVLLHLDSKLYFSLNATGERVWRGLKQGLSLQEISRRLQDEFQVSEEDAEKGVAELIDELREQKLIVADSVPRG